YRLSSCRLSPPSFCRSVVERRDARREGAVEHGVCDRVCVGCWLDEDEATGTAVFGIRRAVPVLDAAIDLQHRLVVPPGVTGFGCEEVPIAAVSVYPQHHIDARTPAEHLPHRQRD